MAITKGYNTTYAFSTIEATQNNTHDVKRERTYFDPAYVIPRLKSHTLSANNSLKTKWLTGKNRYRYKILVRIAEQMLRQGCVEKECKLDVRKVGQIFIRHRKIARQRHQGGKSSSSSMA
jgi:hypothetical protein